MYLAPKEFPAHFCLVPGLTRSSWFPCSVLFCPEGAQELIPSLNLSGMTQTTFSLTSQLGEKGLGLFLGHS